MKAFGTGLLVLLAALLAGCESRPAAQKADAVVATAAPADSVVLATAVASAWLFTAGLSEARRAVLSQATLPPDTSGPLIPKAASSKLPRHPVRQLPPGYTHNRRYVGTLGEQPVVLELTGQQIYQHASGWQQAYSFGSYYFARDGHDYAVSSEGYGYDQPLRLVETRIPTNQYTDDPTDQPDTTGIWQAVERLGPVLTGTWTDKKTRRTAQFKLHEDYTDAVRYEELEVRTQAKKLCRIPNHQVDGTYEDYQRTAAWYGLHLLGPDTLRWQQLQCPIPSRLRQQLVSLLAHTDCKGQVYGIAKSERVNYNGNGLLSYTEVVDTITAANLPSQSVKEHTYDLVIGQECRVADWLRPDKRREIQWLAVVYYNARYHDQSAPGKSRHIKQQLPDFLLASAGIAFRFFKEDVPDAGQPHITHSKPIVIPYAALAPYVRPGTPLARLVAARARPSR